MVIGKKVIAAMVTAIVLWLLVLLNVGSSNQPRWIRIRQVSDTLTSFGGQKIQEDIGNALNLAGTDRQESVHPLEVLTEVPQSSQEIEGSKVLRTHPNVLILSPLKKVSKHLDRYFDLLHSLTYPKNQVSLGYLISDSLDGSYDMVRDHFLKRKLKNLQRKDMYMEVTLVNQDFNYNPGDKWLDIHGLRNQMQRRKVLAKSRNYLLFSALRPYHEWVLWIDSDVSYYPSTLIEDLLRFTGPEKHIITPSNFWKDAKGLEHPYDRNSWQETARSQEFFKRTKEEVVFEGYQAYSTGRIVLGDLRGSNESIVKLDGVGGTVLLVRGRLHREGLVFMPVPYEKSIETEAFGKLALALGYQPWGLPNYITLH